MAEFGIKMSAAARGKERRKFLWGSSNLKNADVVSGGTEKLKAAIIESDRQFAPKIIFIASTCTPAIIGDDIDEVIQSAQGEVAARLIPLHCPGFRTNVIASAYDVFYHGILRNLDFAPREGVDFEFLNPYAADYELSRQRFDFDKKRTVNIINASSINQRDEAELKRLLQALDLKVNIFTEYSSIDDLRKISLAGLNVSLCNTHDDYLLGYLAERFATPYLIHSMPLGIQATNEWLLAVAKHFGKEKNAAHIIEAENARLLHALKPLKEKLQGKRVIVMGGVIRAAYLAVLAKELGMEVARLRTYHFDELSDEAYGRLNEKIPGIEVNIASGQMYEYVHMLKNNEVDLCISHGGTNAWVYKSGVPSTPLFSPLHCYLGYRGVFDQARHFVKNLENTALQRNIAANTKLPYRKNWYEKNVYHYIDNSAFPAPGDA
jgi:nitrogenase molybdenum-iron protein alpha chain